MTENIVLPPTNPIPDDISEQLQQLLKTPNYPPLEDWLAELLKSSGHLADAESLRWRTLAMVWLAMAFNAGKAMPYLMWFNNHQPEMGDQLAEILTDAIDTFDAHLQFSLWRHKVTDERLKTLFENYKSIPGYRQLPALMAQLLNHPYAESTGIWLNDFHRATLNHPSPTLRRWRILTGVWLAANFNVDEGLSLLKEFLTPENTFSIKDKNLLSDTLSEFNKLPAMMQWLAECPNAETKSVLQNILRPDLDDIVEKILSNPPDYSRLTKLAARASDDYRIHKTAMAALSQAGLDLQKINLLDVGCGELAEHSLLASSHGVKVTGIDVKVPPKYLPVNGVKARFQRGKAEKAWKSASDKYYDALKNAVGGKLKWKNATIQLADPTRTTFADGSFDAAICLNYLHTAADVSGVLAESARILKKGALFVASILPFTTLRGALANDATEHPWRHLLNESYATPDGVSLNQWRLSQYQAAFVEHFEIVLWKIEKDDEAADLFTPKFATLIENYAPEELTSARVLVVARRI